MTKAAIWKTDWFLGVVISLLFLFFAQSDLIQSLERKAYDVLNLAYDADRRALRSAYSAKVRAYHPDKNGGNRSYEKALQDVIAAYTHLKTSPAFI